MKPHQEGPLLFEQPFVKVALDASRKTFRTSINNISREWIMLQNSAKDLSSKLKEDGLPLSAEEATATINTMMSRVQNLKRKAEDLYSSQLESSHAKTRRRLVHLQPLDNITGLDDPFYKEWSQLRLDRWLVDWALRTGRTETATKIAEAKSIQDFVEVQLFSEIRKIEASLQKHDCKEALQWCFENKLALKKLKSTLEFDLRLQEFIELTRDGESKKAIEYMKDNLLSWEAEHRPDIEMVLGVLAYSSNPISGPHKRMYDLSRWTTLARTFRQTAYAINSLSSEPMLYLALYAGLAALKHPACYDEDSKNTACPVCDTEGYGKLAQEVPYSHHSISTVICRMTGKITDADNPPMAFPDGQVFSQEAMEHMTGGGGSVSSPGSEVSIQFSELKKVFVA